MKNKHRWKPSKFIYKNGTLKGNRDRSEINIGSRLSTDLTAEKYNRNIKEYVSGKLLDLGCGKVPLYEAYKHYIDDNICVDWQSSLHNNEYLDFECDITQNLPFENNQFNTIILSDVLEHMPEPEKLWKEMYRILEKDGILLLNVPFHYWIHERPYDFYRYTEFALRRFIENTGFQLILLEPMGGSPEVLTDMIAKHLQFIPFIGNILAIILQGFTSLFIKTRLGKKVSSSTAEAYPLGYFLVAKK